MVQIFDLAQLAIYVLVAAASLGLIVTIIRIGKDRWREAASLSGSATTVFKGEVKTDRDGLRDPRVSKGKVWNKATERWQQQGKLSDEYVRNMVG